MYLPRHNNPDTRLLAQIYNITVATYKFYWFVAILDMVVKEQRRHLFFWEIIVGLIAEAWYPILYCQLSFGKADSLYQQVDKLSNLWLVFHNHIHPIPGYIGDVEYPRGGKRLVVPAKQNLLN